MWCEMFPLFALSARLHTSDSAVNSDSHDPSCQTGEKHALKHCASRRKSKDFILLFSFLKPGGQLNFYIKLFFFNFTLFAPGATLNNNFACTGMTIL